ncbi:hypothetical protein V8E36_004080 [Tilletia maclaganii]
MGVDGFYDGVQTGEVTNIFGHRLYIGQASTQPNPVSTLTRASVLRFLDQLGLAQHQQLRDLIESGGGLWGIDPLPLLRKAFPFANKQSSEVTSNVYLRLFRISRAKLLAALDNYLGWRKDDGPATWVTRRMKYSRWTLRLCGWDTLASRSLRPMSGSDNQNLITTAHWRASSQSSRLRMSPSYHWPCHCVTTRVSYSSEFPGSATWQLGNLGEA